MAIAALMLAVPAGRRGLYADEGEEWFVEVCFSCERS